MPGAWRDRWFALAGVALPQVPQAPLDLRTPPGSRYTGYDLGGAYLARMHEGWACAW
jgi:hypothetical protein